MLSKKEIHTTRLKRGCTVTGGQVAQSQKGIQHTRMQQECPMSRPIYAVIVNLKIGKPASAATLQQFNGLQIFSSGVG